MRQKGSYPVICLDEANILKAWQSDARREEDLDTFMRFLIKVNTQMLYSRVASDSLKHCWESCFQDKLRAAGTSLLGFNPAIMEGFYF